MLISRAMFIVEMQNSPGSSLRAIEEKPEEFLLICSSAHELLMQLGHGMPHIVQRTYSAHSY